MSSNNNRLRVDTRERLMIFRGIAASGCAACEDLIQHESQVGNSRECLAVAACAVEPFEQREGAA